MDEFRKPYEYEDEKGKSGLLTLFLAMLLGFETLLGILAAINGYNSVKSISVLGTVYIILGVLMVVYPLFTAFALRKMRKSAIRIVKVYLIVRLVYLIPFFVSNTVIMIGQIRYLKTDIQYAQEFNSLIISLLISLIYLISFSILWYMYFCKSKKVKEFYPGKNEAA